MSLLLVPERGYYVQKEPLERLRADSTPGIFERLGVTPKAEMFKDVVLWDAFLTEMVTAMIRQERPNLLLVHLVQTDYFQHRVGREGAETKAAVARVDAHVGAMRRTLAEVGLADRSVIIVTSDHGLHFPEFADDLDAVLARAAGVRRMVTIGTDAPTVICPVSQILRAARRVSPPHRERAGTGPAAGAKVGVGDIAMEEFRRERDDPPRVQETVSGR